MKKALMLSVLISLLVIASIAMVSATVGYKTSVSGTVYDKTKDYAIVPEAFVNVTCNSNSINTTSLGDGTYWVTFGDGQCLIGNNVTIYGKKGSLEGWNKDPVIVHNITDYIPIDVELGFAPGGDVFLIPEFGIFVGALTLLGAVGVFFFVRKK